MIYTSVLAAVVSALAAECIDSTSKQAWQRLYQSSGEAGDLATLARAARSGELNRQDVDCWVYSSLHSQLKPRHWDALVARYSTHKGRKVESIGALVQLIASHAPRLFVYKAVTAWAIPQLKGGAGKRSTDMIILPAEFYDMNTWDVAAASEPTRRRWRAGVRKTLDDMTAEAVAEAGEILRTEGVLLDVAA